MNIRDEEILRVVPNQKNYNWGMRYYDEYEMFESFTVTKYGMQYEIIANVINFGYENEIVITLNARFEVIEHFCNCRFHEFDSACGHVAAVLLLFQELTITKYPYDLHNDNMFVNPSQMFFGSNQWIEKRKQEQLAFEQRQQRLLLESQQRASKELLEILKEENGAIIHSLTSNEKYKLHFYFEKQIGYYNEMDSFYLDAKIGNDRMYVVKDFRTLFNLIDHEEYHKYGAKLSFVHTYNNFDDFTQQVLPFLKRVMNDMHKAYYTNFRYLHIRTEHIDDFFDLFKDAPKRCINIEFDEQYFKLPIHINEEHEGYFLSLSEDSESLIKGNKYFYKMDKRVLIRYISSNQRQLFRFYEALTKSHLFVKKEDFDEFSKYTLNAFSDNLKIIGIQPEMKENEVKVQLYGDIEEEYLTIHMYTLWEDGQKENALESHPQRVLSLEAQRIINTLEAYGTIMETPVIHVVMPLADKQTNIFYEEILPALKEYAEIFISDTLKRFNPSHSLSLSVGVRVSNDLLAIDISSLECTADEVREVLGSYRRKKQYHRLKNGDMISLETQEIIELDQFLNDLEIDVKDVNGSVEMPLYNAFKLDTKVHKLANINSSSTQSFTNFLNTFEELHIDNLVIKEKYDQILKSYQKYGVKWLMLLSEYGFGGILADDMGLGKTLQAIALMESTYRKGETNIVICPASLMLNWQDELAKFSSELKSCCIYGGIEERIARIRSANEYDVIITTYDYIRRDYEKYDAITFQHIFLDEAQYIKNHSTKVAKSVKKLHGKVRFALTGTPIENTLAELWSIFDFLMPGYLSNYHHFKINYETPIVKNQDEEKQLQLKQLIEPFLLRRRKDEVLKELPEKVEKTLSFHFNKEEEKLYVSKLAEVHDELQELVGKKENNKILILKMLIELRQICCEPRVLYENIDIVSSKMNGCMEIVESLKESGKKILLFSSFTRILDLISQELNKRNISFLVLTGEVSKDKRKDLVSKFQNGDIDIFLISLKAGGVGLNLTKAEAVIHYDPWWNLSAQNQATDRAHRIGQTKNVQVFNLVMKNSIEENILTLQQRKKELADIFVEDSKGSLAQMSTEDIMQLIKR
ncbi:SNF2 family DNA or RNA helicase [Breznakia sp. PF5-3]|uniref:DEAD/DEAH box helicase n=1 Tax=unclassified Breznakia TaxID=2623764 RepID=UPI0024073014|nr:MULTISPECIES: DEAD/DEAH box helicase [unclassified Breznakia]MDF9825539.1 SNF2 family DNA or RNA helicase [Breznakia sp. PM6-1]MDF9836020.1 SNF2 family DNA or RNA helicase [Breznakia sp. PF5-3]MDF9837550.1 SNF2 family DNA or RNA helicase [Breznakia sp. PFB2-8]MDF9860558.1 SNF2 family DNA or RNA helicase [Breznakia sp. PH5-24]